jgi:hypothetical protein
MSHPVKEDVELLLKPFHGRIRQTVERAWDEWKAVSAFRAESSFDPLLYPRTVANYVFDAIARHAIEEFEGDPSVNVKIEPQTVKFFFKAGVLARFKKGDENRLGQNIATQTAMCFMNADGVLPGLPAQTAKVEFIWIPNELQTKLDQVLVVARDSDRLLWEYEIAGADAASEDSVITYPTLPLAPAAVADEKLVKPKTIRTRRSDKK